MDKIKIEITDLFGDLAEMILNKMPINERPKKTVMIDKLADIFEEAITGVSPNEQTYS